MEKHWNLGKRLFFFPVYGIPFQRCNVTMEMGLMWNCENTGSKIPQHKSFGQNNVRKGQLKLQFSP